MKRILAFVCLVFMVGVVFANGNNESSANEEVTLSVLWFNDGNESDIFLDTVSDYLEANPNIKIDLQLVSFGDYDKQLKLMIAGGSPPDIARVTTSHVATFSNSLLPLNDKIADFDSYIDPFNKASLAFATKPNGEIVALPTEATANGMIVNVDLFTNAGIDIKTLSKTWTWDDWYAAMKTVVEKNEGLNYGLGFDFSPHRWSTLLYAAGGRFVNEGGTAMDFDSPETVDTLKFFKKLHDEKLIPPSIWMGSENPQELFQAGLVASHIGGSWVINKYNSSITAFKWAAVNMPKRKIRSSVAGGKFIASFKGAENEAEAVKLMMHFSDQEHNAIYCKETFNLSARTDANITFESRSEDFNIMAEDLAMTPALTAEDWKSPVLGKIYSYIREQIIEGLLENQTMEESAKNIQAKGNEAFK